ncbi:MAG: Na+/H+ antiporter NhaC family protein [Holdemanella sp.]
MLAGGGLVSMLPVCAIVLISSTYSGLLEGTGLIARLKGLLPGVARRLTPFGAVLTTAVVTCGIACNQALPVMLTNQLCGRYHPDRQKMAIDLENTVIVIAPLIPWSIAGAVPIASVGAPAACVLAAFYLWFLPLWQWILAFVERARQTRGA